MLGNIETKFPNFNVSCGKFGNKSSQKVLVYNMVQRQTLVKQVHYCQICSFNKFNIIIRLRAMKHPHDLEIFADTYFEKAQTDISESACLSNFRWWVNVCECVVVFLMAANIRVKFQNCLA